MYTGYMRYSSHSVKESDYKILHAFCSASAYSSPTLSGIWLEVRGNVLMPEASMIHAIYKVLFSNIQDFSADGGQG